MSSNQSSQWSEIASKFQDASKEQKSVLAYHFDAYNRGIMAGLQLGKTKAASFSTLQEAHGATLPEYLRDSRSDEKLFRDFIAFLINEVQINADELDQNLTEEFYDEDELEEFMAGRLAGLRDWESMGLF